MAPPSDFREMVVKRRDACVKFKDGKPARDRKQALDFYNGKNLDAYGDSGDGLSTVVSRDVMESIESVIPPLVRPFVAGEEVVTFDPVGDEDEKAARQATEYVNHVFRRHNNVLFMVETSLKDGLLFRLGVAKTVMEEEEGEPETYDGMDESQLMALQMKAQSEGRELAGDITQDPATGLYGAVLAPKKLKKFRVHVIAPDEFLYEERLSRLDQSTFLGHSKTAMLADVIAMGIDEKKAKSLRSGKPTEEQDARYADEDSSNEDSEWDDDDLARPVQIDECYIRCDYNGDGVLEWRKVILGGAQKMLLSDEPADGHPYSTWTPVPMSHKLVGLSMYDMTRDVQIQKTALQREQLNNLYLVNRPQREVVDGQVNIDDLLNPAINGIVRVKQQGMITPLVTPFVAAETFGMIEYLDGVREARTGVTRYNQGMDANSLNKTATGMNIISNNSQQRQELVARHFGEFLKDVFTKLLHLVRQHADPADVERLLGEFVEWPTEYDATVSVGLGTNNKDQLVAHLNALMQIDQQIIQLQQGLQGPLLTAPNVYEKLKRLCEAMGLKGDGYYTDPSKPPPPGAQPPQQKEPPQDPLGEAKIKAQTEIGKAQIKAGTDVQIAGMKQAMQPQATADAD